MHRHTCFCILCAALGLALAYILFFHQPASILAAPPQGPVSFLKDVAPILKENCFSCHGARNPKSKFDMTKYATLRKGGTKDDPIVPGKPDESLLVDVIKSTMPGRMPPRESGDPLKPEQVAVIEQWIKEGAKLDDGLNDQVDIVRELRTRWQPPALLPAYPYPVVVNALAFTPDNAHLVVGGHHELTVWNVASGKLEKRIRTRSRRALAMVFLPDGKLAVAGGRPGEEGDVNIYDLNGGTPKVDNGVDILDGVADKGVLVAHLLTADDEVLCLALSADGKRLASGGCDRIVNVWDLSKGYTNLKPQTIENHADWVFGVAFAPDGTHLFTSGRDKTAKVYDLAAQESVLTFPEHQNSVNGVAVKADGKQGYSVGDDNQLRSWNVSGDQAGKQIKVLGNHGKSILKLAERHPELPLLATCSADGTIKIWNADSGANTKTLSGFTDQVFAVALSPDGNLVAGGAWNGEVKIWKIADGALVQAFNGAPGYKAPEPVVPPKK